MPNIRGWGPEHTSGTFYSNTLKLTSFRTDRYACLAKVCFVSLSATKQKRFIFTAGLGLLAQLSSVCTMSPDIWREGSTILWPKFNERSLNLAATTVHLQDASDLNGTHTLSQKICRKLPNTKLLLPICRLEMERRTASCWTSRCQCYKTFFFFCHWCCFTKRLPCLRSLFKLDLVKTCWWLWQFTP